MAPRHAFVSLPAELVVAIMSHLYDVQVLQDLTRTCKTLHKIFQQNRRSIIMAILNRMINTRCGVAVEADECEAAANIRPSGLFDSDQALFDFLDRYRTRRAQQLAFDQTFQRPESTIFYVGVKSFTNWETRSIERTPLGVWPAPTSSLSYLQKLYDRHMVIQHCVDKFCGEVLATPASPTLSEPLLRIRSGPLSPSERKRLYRAFYRVELYHQIYHGSRDQDLFRIPRPIRNDIRDYVWLCTFPPHEWEEIATVYQWLDDGWKSKLKQVDTDLKNWRDRQLYVDEGLAAYLEASAEDDHDKLVRISQRCRAKPVHQLVYLGTCSISNSPFFNIRGPTTAQGGLPRVVSCLTFEHEHLDCPNYAWLWSHNFMMSAVVHHYSHTHLRQIGHVMWDKPRLESWDIYKKTPPDLQRSNWRWH